MKSRERISRSSIVWNSWCRSRKFAIICCCLCRPRRSSLSWFHSDCAYRQYAAGMSNAVLSVRRSSPRLLCLVHALHHVDQRSLAGLGRIAAEQHESVVSAAVEHELLHEEPTLHTRPHGHQKHAQRVLLSPLLQVVLQIEVLHAARWRRTTWNRFSTRYL